MEEIKLLNPTGGKIRVDAAGDGHFGTSRNGRTHKGVDFECIEGQNVVAPCAGIVTRQARPYPDGDLLGVVINSNGNMLTMFYMQPDLSLLGHYVEAGQVIGKAQAVSKRYPNQGMKDHVHTQYKHKTAGYIDIEPLIGD